MADTTVQKYSHTGAGFLEGYEDLGDGTHALKVAPIGAGGAAGAVTLAAALPAGTNHIGQVGGRTATIGAALTRPADTTQYGAGDAVGNSTTAPTVLTFPGCGRVAGGSGVIIGALLVDSANQPTAAQYELWLFDTTITPDNDNAPFTPTDAECLTLVGIIPFSTSYVGDATGGAGGNRVYVVGNLSLAFNCGAAITALYGAIVVRNAYTPVNAETLSIRLRILQD